jgi:acyl-CoA dehydrogenase
VSAPTSTRSRSIFTEDHEAFRDSVRRFVESEIVPNLEGWRDADGVSRDVITAAGEAGFLGITVPEEFGGGESDDPGFLAVLIDETVDAGATGLALLWALHAGITIPVLLAHGTDDDRSRWLPGLADGSMVGVPAAGTLAGVPGAALADVLLVDSADGVRVVPTDAAGVTVTPVTGALAAPEAAAADVTVSGADGSRGTALSADAAVTLRRSLDLWLAVLALAGARRSLNLALDYARSRKVFGRPLAEFENTRLRLSELSAELASATTYVDQCVAALGAQTLTPAQAAAARYTAAALHDRTVDQSLQLHGGYGYMREYPIAAAYADARFLRVTGALFSDPRQAVAEDLGL